MLGVLNNQNEYIFQNFGSTHLHISNTTDRSVVVYNASDSAPI